MLRHDPLSSLAPNDVEPMPAPEPAPKARKPKLPPVCRELAAVTDSTLAFLYGGVDQQPGDYERNKLRGAEIRADFTAFCAEREWAFANWRQAWAAFIAAHPAETVADELTSPEPAVVPVQFQPAIPAWRQRLRQRYAVAA